MKFRKAMALALAGAMTLSSFTAFAAQSSDQKGKALYDLGLFQGYSKTEMKLGLEDGLTREQAIKLTLSFLGYDESDLKEVKQSVFTDVTPGTKWAEPWVQLATDLGLTSGVSETEFGYGKAVTKHQLTTFMLRALGYDNAWTKAAELGLELDLLAYSDLASFEEESKRADFASIGYNTLTAQVADKNMTLVQKLADTINKDAAKELGLIEEKVVTFNVESVEAVNLAETRITFTKGLDKDAAAEDKVADFKVNKKSVKKIIKEDDTTLLLFHDAIENGKSVKVEVKNVKDVDGNKIDKTEQEVKYLDTELPTLVDAEVVGSKVIRLTFSEAMEPTATAGEYNKDAFKVTKENGSKVYVRNAKTAGKNNRQVDLTLSTTLKEEQYTVAVNANITDYAKFGLVDSITVDVTKDEEAPTVVDYKDASETGVTLIFSEDIVKNNPKNTDFYHTNSKNTVKATDGFKIVDGKELKLTFDKADKLPQGTAYVFVKKDILKDLWGNKIEDIKYKISIKEDIEAPIIESVEQGKANNQIIVTYKEADLDLDTVKKKSNYTVINDKDKAVMVKGFEVDSKGKKVTLTLKDDIAGEATIQIKDIKDKNSNKMDTEDFVIEFVDKVAPKFPSDDKFTRFKTEDEFILSVKFKDAGRMAEDGEYSVLDQAKYQVVYTPKDKAPVTKELKDIDNVEIRVTEDGDTVEVVIPQDSIGVDSVITTLKMARVADAEGNTTADLVAELSYKEITAVEISKVEAVDVNKVAVTIKGKLDNVDFDDFSFDGFTNNTIGSTEVTTDSDKNTVLEFYMEDEFKYTVKENAKLVIASTVKSQTQYGTKLKNDYATDAAVLAVKDKVVPVFDKDATEKLAKSTTNNVYVLKFKENLKSNNDALKATDLKVEFDGKQLAAGIDYDIAIEASNKNEIKITFMGNYEVSETDAALRAKFEKFGSYSVEVKDAKYIGDDTVQNNKLANFTFEFTREEKK